MLDLDSTLAYQNISRGSNGFSFGYAIRPYAQEFLQALSSWDGVEVILWTAATWWGLFLEDTNSQLFRELDNANAGAGAPPWGRRWGLREIRDTDGLEKNVPVPIQKYHGEEASVSALSVILPFRDGSEHRGLNQKRYAVQRDPQSKGVFDDVIVRGNLAFVHSFQKDLSKLDLLSPLAGGHKRCSESENGHGVSVCPSVVLVDDMPRSFVPHQKENGIEVPSWNGPQNSGGIGWNHLQFCVPSFPQIN